MYVIRTTLYAKPGHGKDLIEKLKAATLHFEKMGAKSARVLTDTIATTWTIAMEMEFESVGTYFEMADGRARVPEIGEAMQGYTDLVTGGKREIFEVA